MVRTIRVPILRRDGRISTYRVRPETLDDYEAVTRGRGKSREVFFVRDDTTRKELPSGSRFVDDAEPERPARPAARAPRRRARRGARDDDEAPPPPEERPRKPEPKVEPVLSEVFRVTGADYGGRSLQLDGEIVVRGTQAELDMMWDQVRSAVDEEFKPRSGGKRKQRFSKEMVRERLEGTDPQGPRGVSGINVTIRGQEFRPLQERIARKLKGGDE